MKNDPRQTQIPVKTSEYEEAVRTDVRPVSWAWKNRPEQKLKKPIFPIAEVQDLAHKWANQKDFRRKQKRVSRKDADKVER